MKLTAQEWTELAGLHRAACAAVEKLDHELAMAAIRHGQPEGAENGMDVLIGLTKHTQDALVHLRVIDVQPQQEWMGGDSSNPKNYKWREPRCVGMRQEYLGPVTVEENCYLVQE